jgi:hypothetical protein
VSCADTASPNSAVAAAPNSVIEQGRSEHEREHLQRVEAAELRDLDGERRQNEKDAGDPSRESARFASHPDEQYSGNERDEHNDGDARAREPFAEYLVAQGNEPRVQKSSTVFSLGNQRPPGLQKMLRRQHVVELVGMRWAVQIDRE